jgi:hypothetical protein
MEGFEIKGEGSFITISFEEVYGFPDTTCHWGGYDVRATVEIKSGNFRVRSTLCTSTGELFQFFQQLKACNNKLHGVVNYNSYEGNLNFIATYDKLGHVNIKGAFFEFSHCDNKLIFEFNTDQSFISQTIKELELIATKYGGMLGIKETK